MKKQQKTAFQEMIDLTEGVEAKIEDHFLTLQKGHLTSTASFRGFHAQIEGGKVVLSTPRFTKKQKRLINTFKAHVKNIFQGFHQKYRYKLQVSSVHFPMTVTFDKMKREVVIKNFLGERIPRVAKIFPDTDVKIEKDLVIIESHDKHAAGQSAANIEAATRITKRDRRVFQDGIWIVEKAGEAL